MRAAADAASGRALLRAFLARTRNADGGWPYYAGRRSRLEPTCWALLATSEAPGPLERWPTSGGLFVDPQVSHANFAFNALAALTLAGLSNGSHATAAALAATLVEHKGVALPNVEIIRQDSSLQGWAWMDGAFSWIEPTAWCLLALKKLAPAARVPAAADRIAEAERLMADRACQGGGWNYGNARIYGQHLPAHVPPTAVAVLALQDRPAMPALARALEFLERRASSEASSTALALAWLALSVARREAGHLAPALAGRASLAVEFGNVAAAALALYALECADSSLVPAALTVPGADSVSP
jgi:hypothetical protein